MSKNPQSPETCLNQWIQDLTDYGLLSKTLTDYRTTANVLFRTMLDNEREVLPYKWTKTDTKFLKDFWDEKGLKTKTQISYHTIFTNLAEHFGNFAPSSYRIHWPSLTGDGRRWLELLQARTVINHPMSPMQRIGIELMLRMGRRRVENLRALLSQMFPEAKDPYMIVDGKGHKRHIMPFAPTTYKIYYEWMDYRDQLIDNVCNHPRKAREEHDQLFLYARGGKIGYYDIEKGSGYDKAVTNAVSASCGIKFSNHDLRRTFGRELYFTSRIDPVIIQGYYNHNSLDQTLWYIGADQRRMSEAIQQIAY